MPASAHPRGPAHLHLTLPASSARRRLLRRLTRSYATPLAFKAALEARLHERAARQGRSLNRVRQLLVMERSLARVFPAIGSAVLKGGLVMELRLDRARVTKDVDLLVFEMRTDAMHPVIEGARARTRG